MDNIIEFNNLINYRHFIVGIDPGKKGAVVGLDYETGSIAWMEPLPLVGDQFDPVSFLLAIHSRPKIKHIVLEHAQSFRGQGIVSTFNYARDFGIIVGILTATKLPFTLVKPQLWQKTMFVGTSPGVDPKVRAFQVASRLWPSISFLPGPKSKKPHDGMVDAALIAEYGRRVL